MTSEIQAIKDRLAAATQGPWEYRHTFTETHSGKQVLCIYGPRNSAPNHCLKMVLEKENPTAEDEANAKLTVILRNTASTLLADNKRLEGVLSHLRRKMNPCDGMLDLALACRDMPDTRCFCGCHTSVDHAAATPQGGVWLCEACDTTQDADTEADADGCCPACVASKEQGGDDG